MSRIARALALFLLLPGLAAAQLKPARMSNATTENLTLIPGSITTNNITAVALATPGSITVTPVLTQTATITTVAAGWRANGLLTAVPKASLVDGETFVLSDGTHVPQSFEFDVAGDGVTGGRVQVDVSTATDAASVAAFCAGAIDATTSATFTIVPVDNLDGTVTLRNSLWAASGNTPQSETVTAAGFVLTNMTGGVDAGIVDGDYLTIKYSLAGTIPIEFDTGDGTTGGRIPLVFDGTESADDIRDALITVINAAAPAALTASSGGAATVNITLDVPGAVGDTNTENVADGTFAVTGFVSPTATTWTYKLVARLVDGTTTEAGAASSTAAGGPTLSAANANVLTWSKVTNAASYDVYRTVAGTSPATLGKINAGPIVGVTLTDSGLAGDTSTPPTVNGTGVITAARFAGAGMVPSGCSASSVPFFLGSPVALGCDAGLTYDAVTDTLTTKLSYPRPSSNDVFTLWSTTPPAGRTYEAPYELHFGGAEFESEWDPVMYLGYNASRSDATEPTMRWVIEGNYKHARRDIEAYWEYVTPTGETWRPIFMFKDKSQTSIGGEQMVLNNELITQSGTRAAPIGYKFEPINANQSGTLSVSGTGTGGGDAQFLRLIGGYDPDYGASIFAFGNACTNVSGAKGVLKLIGGNPATPTAGSLEGAVAVFTGATSTERLKVEPGGNVVIGNPGVAGAALLDVNGTTRATQYRLSALNTAPASAVATGTAGEIRVTATAIYVCTATDTWVKADLASW